MRSRIFYALALVLALSVGAIAGTDTATWRAGLGTIVGAWYSASPGTATEGTFSALTQTSSHELRVAVTSSVAPSVASKATYYKAFTLVAPVGDFVEIKGGAGKTVRVLEIDVSKPSAACRLTIIKRSAVDTGGTATTYTPGAGDSLDGVAVARVKAYTVAPTQGAAVDTFDSKSLGTNDTYFFTTGAGSAEPITLYSGESLCLVSDTIATFDVAVLVTEE